MIARAFAKIPGALVIVLQGEIDNLCWIVWLAQFPPRLMVARSQSYNSNDFNRLRDISASDIIIAESHRWQY
jgi:hypothetical protein